MISIILGFLRPYLSQIIFGGIALVLAYAGYRAIYNSGYSAGEQKYFDLVSQIKEENTRLKAIQDQIKYYSVFEHKEKIIYLEKKSSQVRESIGKGELHEESANCTIGPNFVRLHNKSADN